MTYTTKIIVIMLIASLGIIAAVVAPPLAQDPAYHNFTDTRTLHSISNFWNVISNVPFIVFGLLGLYVTSRTLPYGHLKQLQHAYTVLFTGVILMGLSSGYYHLNPSNDTLFWDRLFIAITFMALFSIIISEYISLAIGRFLFIPLLAIGAGSVIYWFQSEQLGTGDLRPYALVQFLPAVLIPAMLIFFKSSARHSKYIWAVLFFFLLSKLPEYFDVYFYDLSREISGHTLKHFLGSLGVLLLIFHFNNRKNITDE